jgi:signal peptidase
MIACAIIGLLVAVYVAINFALPYMPVDILIRTYLLQPALWGVVIATIHLLPDYRPLAKLSARNKFYMLALGIALVQITLYFIGGMFSGFGKNPSSLTTLGILTNIFFVGTMLAGMELSRAWLVTSLGRKHDFLTLTTLAFFFSFLSIPFAQIAGFKFQIESVNTFTSSWVPLLAESMIASLLVLIAGTKASLIYRGLLAAFWWLCPVLPDLTWGFKSLIGVGVPIIGITSVNSVYNTIANRSQPAGRVSRMTFPAGWVVIALVCVTVVWFIVGVFPIEPSLIGSGSMTPALEVGDVVIVAQVPANSIKTGDIIEYRMNETTKIVHRVIGIDDIGGLQVFTTRGDANTAPDSVKVIPANIVGKVVFHIPKIGLISIAIKNMFWGSNNGEMVQN